MTAPTLSRPASRPATVSPQPTMPIVRLLVGMPMWTSPRGRGSARARGGAAGVRGEAPRVAVRVDELAHAVAPEHVLRRQRARGARGRGPRVEGVHVLTVDVQVDRRRRTAVDRGLSLGLRTFGAEHDEGVLPGHLDVHDLAIRPGDGLACVEAERL